MTHDERVFQDEAEIKHHSLQWEQPVGQDIKEQEFPIQISIINLFPQTTHRHSTITFLNNYSDPFVEK
jgi:hypothetical protein